MELFFTLLLAHLLADFPLQTNTIIRIKSRHWGGVLLHVLIYVAVTGSLLWQPWQHLSFLFLLGSIHFIIDLVKLNFIEQPQSTSAFLVDQLAHLLTMIAIVCVVQVTEGPVPSGILSDSTLFMLLPAALIPAIMVLCWVWMINKGEEFINKSSLRRWVRGQMLVFEQCFGFAVMSVILWILAIQKYEDVLQIALF